jgi:hypothetical protein
MELKCVVLRYQHQTKEKPRTPRRGFSGPSGSSDGTTPDPRTYPFSNGGAPSFCKASLFLLCATKSIFPYLFCSVKLRYRPEDHNGETDKLDAFQREENHAIL